MNKALDFNRVEVATQKFNRIQPTPKIQSQFQPNPGCYSQNLFYHKNLKMTGLRLTKGNFVIIYCKYIKNLEKSCRLQPG